MHVHTLHSGMCTVPLACAVCRESYSEPRAVYERLKRMGMDLVTVTDHDSIDAVECLRKHPDFFLSEEVTCRMPSGTELHLGVYDIDERQHSEIAQRRDDVPRLAAYLRQERLLFSANHVFSRLTGRRAFADFECFEELFPAIETRNGHMLPSLNLNSERLARRLGKAQVGGSDAHALPSVGLAYTEVPGARSKDEFLEGVRRGRGLVRGECGNYWKLTRDVFLIVGGMVRENPATLPLAAFSLLAPAVILANTALELMFSSRWMRALDRAWTAAPAGGLAEEAPA